MKRWGSAWISAGVVAAVVAGLSAPALARKVHETAEEHALLAKARALYESATAHYNLAEYKEALEGFREAYRLKPDPAFLFNIGQCDRQLGNVDEAGKVYRSYLRAAPNAPNRVDVEQFIADADAAMAAKAKQVERQPMETQPPQLGAPETASAPVAATGQDLTAAPPPVAPQPKRTRKWVWGVVGAAAGVVVVGLGVGLGVGLTEHSGMPSASLGGMGVTWQ